jgi:hypothetical protein
LSVIVDCDSGFKHCNWLIIIEACDAKVLVVLTMKISGFSMVARMCLPSCKIFELIIFLILFIYIDMEQSDKVFSSMLFVKTTVQKSTSILELQFQKYF